MKKLLFLIVAVALMASCNSDMDDTQSGPATPTVKYVVDDFVQAEPLMRSALSAEGKFTWAAGDAIGVIPDGSYQFCFEVDKATTGTNSATFNGGGFSLTTNQTYYAYSPYSPENYAKGIQTKVAYDLSGQTALKANSTEGLGAFDYLYASAVPEAVNSAVFQFHHAMAILAIKVKAAEATTVGNISVRTNGAFSTAGTYRLNNGATTSTKSTTALNFSTDNVTLSKGQTATYYLMIAPADLIDKKINVTIGTTETEVDGFDIQSGHLYTINVSSSDKATGNTINGHKYVDMGLPSGILWAESNMGFDNDYVNGTKGATKGVYSFGDFYAWGATEPYYTTITHNYSGGLPLFNSGYSKAYSSANTTPPGSSDNIAATQYDAAYVKWGGDANYQWQMPTYTQCDELITYTTWERMESGNSEFNGVPGLKLTSTRNGNVLFLPGVGRMRNTAVYTSGSVSYYGIVNAVRIWTASGGYFFAFDYSYKTSGPYTIASGSRYDGQQIRPIAVKK